MGLAGTARPGGLMIALQVAVIGVVVLLALCLAFDVRDRRHGHRARRAGALDRVTFDHRHDDKVIEDFVQAARDPGWMAPR